MNKKLPITALVLIVTFLMTASVSFSFPMPPESVLNVAYGDVNADGKINSADLSLIKRHMLGLATLSGDAFTAADVDPDGKINSND